MTLTESLELKLGSKKAVVGWCKWRKYIQGEANKPLIKKIEDTFGKPKTVVTYFGRGQGKTFLIDNLGHGSKRR